MSHPNAGILRPGEMFCDRYKVVCRIKAGGMGTVYEVIDERTNTHRALKVMLPSLIEDEGLRSRFEREARIAGALDSDHVVRVSDAGVDPETETPFLVMDLLRGEDLKRTLARRRALPSTEVVIYLLQAAHALERTHRAGVVHRDFKPENLFVTHGDDGSPCVKLLDFGIAKVIAESNRTDVTQMLGTPVYMSPEQIRGESAIGLRSDIYAFGHVAYALLAGEAYWTEELTSLGALYLLFSKILFGPTEAPSARARRRRGILLPPAFDAWFLKATALIPEDRYASALSAAAALTDALGATVPSVTPEALAADLMNDEQTVIDGLSGSRLPTVKLPTSAEVALLPVESLPCANDAMQATPVGSAAARGPDDRVLRGRGGRWDAVGR
jgi:serine/threonine-protein kinase